jgi:DNA polymerase
MVLGGMQNSFGEAIASALGWWAEAGVDASIAETPRNWLAPPARPIAPAAAAVAPAKTATLPDDLAAFRHFLAEQDYLPGAPPPRRRVAPFGDPASGLMIISDVPDPADLESRLLLGGECARLFDAMLAALGRSRDSVYAAPLSPARVAGRIAADMAAPLARLMRHHIALARPRAVMLMGEETCRALLGQSRVEARGDLRALNHDGGTVPAVIIPHPRSLRLHPAAKADAWREMRRLTGVLAA